MALAVSCLRPLSLLPRTIRVSSLALSCLVRQRYDLQVVEDTIALTNPTDSKKILAYWLPKAQVKGSRSQADGIDWGSKRPSEFELIEDPQTAKVSSGTAFALALEGGLEQGVTKVLETEVDQQKIVFPRMGRAIW